MTDLATLIASATQEDLADGGRYFADSLCDLTRCRHSEIGEYLDAADGELIEWLWNHRHAIAARFPADIDARSLAIADQAVPQHRSEKPGGGYYSCTGIYAKRWQAAYDAAQLALGGNP